MVLFLSFCTIVSLVSSHHHHWPASQPASQNILEFFGVAMVWYEYNVWVHLCLRLYFIFGWAALCTAHSSWIVDENSVFAGCVCAMKISSSSKQPDTPSTNAIAFACVCACCARRTQAERASICDYNYYVCVCIPSLSCALCGCRYTTHCIQTVLCI